MQKKKKNKQCVKKCSKMVELGRVGRWIGEYFHDDDLLLEEWLHCQNCREPFVIHEEDEFGDELIFEIRTGEELFDYFENMKSEAERGIRKFRY